VGNNESQTFCQEHLSDGDRKSIAEGLYKVAQHYASRQELHGLCPFHEEKEASFSYNYAKDVFACQGCGVKPGDLIDLWCHVKGHDRKSGGFKAFCDYAGLNWDTVKDWLSAHKGNPTSNKKSSTKQKPAPDPEPVEKIDESGWKQKVIPETVPEQPEEPEEKFIPEEVWAAFPPIPDDMVEELIRRRKWSREGIAKADLKLYVHRSAKDKPKAGEPFRKIPFGEKRVAIPVRDDDGRLRNLRLYAPFGTSDGYPKITSWGTGYGEARLLPSPALWGSGALWYCEGEPDWICALSQGLNAITKTGGAKTHKKEWNRRFRGREVIFVYDADKTGLEGAEKGAVFLERDAESVRVVMWPRFMYADNPAVKWDGKKQFSDFVMKAGEDYPQDHGYDLTDFFTRYERTEKDLRELLATAKIFTRSKSGDADLGGAARFFAGSRGTTFKPVLLAEAYLNDCDLVTDADMRRPFLWNGGFFEEYKVQYIQTAVTRMLEKEATTKYVNDASNIILNLSALEHGRTFNDRTEWVCLKNGMLNLNTAELVPHSRDFYSTYQLGVAFRDGGDEVCPECKGEEGHVECELCWGRGYLHRCSRWIQFLKETVQVRDTILQLQEFFGLCLTRETRFGKCLLMTGPGSDGKSKVLDILTLLVGEDNCSAVSIAELEKPFSRAMLYNKALNVSAEIDSGAIHSETFKKLATGDNVSAEFKHKDGFQFRFWGKLAFASNNPPRILDNSDGLFRRFIVIKFKRQFLEDDPATDIYLDEKLRSELDDIFLWALEGLERLFRQQRFTHSADSAEALMEFKRGNNPILCFAEDRLLYRPGNPRDLRLSRSAVYKDYQSYCNKWGYTAAGFTHFGRGLRGIFRGLADGRLRDESRDKCYMGLTFADSDEAAAILRDELLSAAAATPSPRPSLGGAPQYNEGRGSLSTINYVVPDGENIPDLVPDKNTIRDAKRETIL